MPCHNVFNEDSLEHFGYGLEHSHIFTFFITFLIGAISLGMSNVPYGKPRSLKITCALYAMETALFALARFYLGVSSALVGKFYIALSTYVYFIESSSSLHHFFCIFPVIAALHNLFEWSIVWHVAEAQDDRFLLRRLSYSFIFILVVITFSLVRTNLCCLTKV